jgi:hypothetical protein
MLAAALDNRTAIRTIDVSGKGVLIGASSPWSRCSRWIVVRSQVITLCVTEDPVRGDHASAFGQQPR